MNPESRLALAVALVLAVLIGTTLLMPSPEPGLEGGGSEPVAADASNAPASVSPSAMVIAPEGDRDEDPSAVGAEERPPGPAIEPREIRVEGGVASYRFNTRGAALRSVQLQGFRSFTREGPVELIPEESLGWLGSRVVVGADTVDLRGMVFEVEPADGLRLVEGGETQTLTFRYLHPSQGWSVEVRYSFEPSSYVIGVVGRVRGLERGLLLSDLGQGIAFNETDDAQERASMAYVVNHLQEGIRSQNLLDVDRSRLEEGPFRWVAVKSRYFVIAALPAAEEGGTEFFGGLVARVRGEAGPPDVAMTQSLSSAGVFAYRLLAGPQEYGLLASLGDGLQEVNPVGWKFLRPVLRPFVALVMWVLAFFHENLAIGYGWVLVLFGILMRVVLFPLYHKAMRAQLRNMVVQPLLKDIQTRYKDNPERMQKELMRLYKEHGFNPLAGCWPMLLPFPILIALFFVFQNTIELRGVPFGWLPDLSAKDPLYILPVLLGISMFLMQWISMRTLDEVNPQMKIMMWALPIGMVVIFANFPSGLNLYYLTSNIATLPQSWWVANERQRMKAKGPPTAPSR
jgi:YidC/Oxa1 family membrane protein insertase